MALAAVPAPQAEFVGAAGTGGGNQKAGRPPPGGMNRVKRKPVSGIGGQWLRTVDKKA